MKKIILLLVLISAAFSQTYGQTEERNLLRGKVMYRNSNVQNENVINVTTEKGVVTNANGEFEINVKLGDELVFTAVNYQIKRVRITQEILDNNRLVVEVNEKVTELDEVVVTPENEEAFIKLKNEEFKKYEYGIDETSRVENIALSQTERGMQNGINFVNIFKAIKKGLKGEDGEEVEQKQLKVSDVLRQVYDDQFFVKDLSIPQDKINDFLFYCDTRLPEQSLLKKTNEFQLIDFLVNESKEFRKQLDDKN
ncbi:carboxypeptidase-like regulatory domain-containing protein [Cellulophaga tyrosinoxydans]|uniref:CarboxypepD_reg-like domain-containing protein n=1 Tax=Cellulophaga tyrosinoxydans TaxID=504486 RepID=A0A1W1Y7S2_9FLAO|nr:carboxypeptidase-like regulatory domain-containing protein [Cellulophaga tyrosinoxydans]SMC32203.1 CarboxypepD_reg-like domain-containing protein [Cellulophaga tyrosinoxydans]